MVKQTITTYKCGLCKYEGEQLSHIKSHLETEKHIDKRELAKLKIEKLTPEEILEKFKKSDIEEILKECEMIKIVKEKVFEKKSKTNRVIYDSPTRSNIGDKEFKDKFVSFLNKMHNLLRGAAVTGEDAFNDIMYTLFLCRVEDKIEELDLFNYEHYSRDISKKLFEEEYKNKVIRISDLIKEKGNLRNPGHTSSIEMCGEILSSNPKTKDLIKNKNFINCTDINIISKIFEETIEFNKKNNIFDKFDIIGLGYEYFSSKYGGNGGTSKEMGQYFTERPLMFKCFKLIDEQDLKDLNINKDSTIGDEFCATFGFPLALKKYLEEEYKIKLKDKNIYGVEFHEKLSIFSKMNALFSMKNFDNVIRGDSFITNVSPHLDISVHNVPFGNSMTPKIISETYKNYYERCKGKDLPELKDYLPFCAKKIDAILASQVVLYKTKKMGLLIIKDGEETSGKNNAKYRKWFCESCVVKKIMKIPSGSFSCTATKTVCIYFIKKEGKKTEKIQFSELSEDGNKITEICNLSMEDLKQNNFSWDPNVYIKDEAMEKLFRNNICEWKKLGDIIDINIGSTPSTKKKEYWENGKYIWITISDLKNNLIPLTDSKKKLTDLAIKECNLKLVKKGTVLMSFKLSIGKMGITGHDCYTNEAILHINNQNNIINKYIYFYFYYNKPVSSHGCLGNGNLNKQDLSELSIPFPSLEIQEETVKMLDELSSQKENLDKKIENINNIMKRSLENSYK